MSAALGGGEGTAEGPLAEMMPGEMQDRRLDAITLSHGES
jgi:hypothetical protein